MALPVFRRLWLAAALVSCTEPPPTHDETAPGRAAHQPDGGDPTDVLDEEEACQALSDAETATREALGCEARDIACPAYIRPAGGCDTFVYTAESVNACVDIIDDYDDCDDFSVEPCVVTALPTDGSCGSAGAGGAGGAGGATASSGGNGTGGALGGAGGAM